MGAAAMCVVAVKVGVVAEGAARECEFAGGGMRRNCGVGEAVKRESAIWQEVAGMEASDGELCDFDAWWWQAPEVCDGADAGRHIDREQRAAQRGAIRRQKARATAAARERKRIALERMGILYSVREGWRESVANGCRGI
jgi:hypothetical protein